MVWGWGRGAGESYDGTLRIFFLFFCVIFPNRVLIPNSEMCVFQWIGGNFFFYFKRKKFYVDQTRALRKNPLGVPKIIRWGGEMIRKTTKTNQMRMLFFM
jgi:hypothetical protein